MTKRIAIVDRELCNPKLTGYACKKACPINRSGKECITVAEDTKVLINEELCIGCGICVKKCDRKALKVVNLPEKLQEDPIHRYGPNLFCLFRLPIPKPNSVVGLVGQNGMGKSTVLNILAGNFKPNLGRFQEAPWESIIDRFKGTELQGYLEILAGKGVQMAYKPQHVDQIPELWKGKVRPFLDKLDKDGSLEGISSRLGMEGMLNKNISQLSGGELQLLAVTATLLKKADLYFFDEPSSYLDVRERLLVAKEIRSLAQKARVMVVEHDMSVADYLADYTHILYGEPGVFGIVSDPYGVRVGINTYLEGYIREENVRFRDESITFSRRAKGFEKDKLFLQFPGFRKSFSSFRVETAGGNLYRGEVIGILGPNATGKTTFIKMLAGLDKPDSGESPKGLKLAYKPQRLILNEKDSNLNVKDYLEEKSGKRPGSDDFRRITKSLNLPRLFERRMGNLSGGELQLVLIASALIQEKELLLMDEPSAFLDVEQRLKVAKLLRAEIETLEIPCFVVDHDLLFVDVLSDRIMVFSGTPGVNGKAETPYPLLEGMNKFLKELGVTYRRDPVTGRPRANKPGSQKDKEQKESGKFYYAD